MKRLEKNNEALVEQNHKLVNILAASGVRVINAPGNSAEPVNMAPALMPMAVMDQTRAMPPPQQPLHRVAASRRRQFQIQHTTQTSQTGAGAVGQQTQQQTIVHHSITPMYSMYFPPVAGHPAAVHNQQQQAQQVVHRRQSIVTTTVGERRQTRAEESQDSQPVIMDLTGNGSVDGPGNEPRQVESGQPTSSTDRPRTLSIGDDQAVGPQQQQHQQYWAVNDFQGDMRAQGIPSFVPSFGLITPTPIFPGGHGGFRISPLQGMYSLTPLLNGEFDAVDGIYPYAPRGGEIQQ